MASTRAPKKTKSRRKIVLGVAPLTLEQLYQVAWATDSDGLEVVLGPQARARIEKAHRFLLTKLKSGATFYGINTGFGLLSNVRIDGADLAQLQLNLIR